MTKYETLILKLSYSKLSKLKLRIKDGTQVTSNLSSNAICYPNDETNFTHK